MYFKHYFLVICLFFFTVDIFSQSTVGGIPGKGMDMNTFPNGFVSQVNLADYSIGGSVYLFEDWTPGTIYFTNDQTLECSFNINLQTKNIEVLDGETVKFATPDFVDKIKTLKFGDAIFQYKEIVVDEVKIKSYYKVLHEGESFSAFEEYSVYLKGSTYVPALDVGDRNEKYILDEKFLIKSNGNYFYVKGGKRKFSENFPNPDKLIKFIKENNLNHKDEKDLVIIMEFLNQSVDNN